MDRPALWNIGPAVAIVAVLLVGACVSRGDGRSGPATTTASTATGADSDLLVEVVKSGGLCAGDVCGEQVAIRRDGSWTRTVNGKRSTGKLSGKDAGEMRAAVDQQGPAIATLPQTRTRCPSATDGQDVIYTYHFAGTTAEASNCKVDVAGPNPLLALTGRILGKIG
ncbi:MAG: hypothetical protein QOG43_1035 [Actinomycetota bacterium]|nr:hypothetical protein [Actinomycetota bacterium]